MSWILIRVLTVVAHFGPFVRQRDDQGVCEFPYSLLSDGRYHCLSGGNWWTPCRYACCTDLKSAPQHPSWHVRARPEALGRLRQCARASQAPAWEKEVAEGGPGREGAPRVSLRRARTRYTIPPVTVSCVAGARNCHSAPVLPCHERTQCAPARMSVSFQWSCSIAMSADHLSNIAPSPRQLVCSWGKRRASRRRRDLLQTPCECEPRYRLLLGGQCTLHTAPFAKDTFPRFTPLIHSDNKPFQFNLRD